jgi:FkbM family methyltransferase
LISASGEQFMLLDVGASGGISKLWSQFGESLRAHGFDPLIAEIDRLNATEDTGRIRYHTAFVTCHDQTILNGLKTDGLPNTQSFERTSAARAARVTQTDYVREQFNQGAAVQYTNDRTTIDDFCSEHDVRGVDFIKVDTDGHDYYVLQGARRTLTSHGVLGVEVECQFHGTPHPHANTFANIDRYLRELGFALFDMNVWRYTRGALPGRFYYDIMAQTTTGPVQWCEALYLLDPVTRPDLFTTLRPSQLVKLLMLYDLFCLPDCAAELITELGARKIVIPSVDYGRLLDLLAPGGRYNQYVESFDRNPKQFFPSTNKPPASDTSQRVATPLLAAPPSSYPRK